jgi:hypothetical protein
VKCSLSVAGEIPSFIVSAILDAGATSEGVLLEGWWLVDIHDYISEARFQTNRGLATCYS